MGNGKLQSTIGNEISHAFSTQDGIWDLEVELRGWDA
jgi:predicted metalloendopeptidase